MVALAATLALAVGVAGCTGGTPQPAPSDATSSTTAPPRPVARGAAPEGVTTLDEQDASLLALATSRTFFEAAPLAVLVDTAGDDGSTAAAAAGALAEQVGAPVLVTGGAASDDDLVAELDRLGAVGTVRVGPPPADATAEPTADPTDATTDPTTDAPTDEDTDAPTGAAPQDLGRATVSVDPGDVLADDGTPDDAALAAAVDAARAELPPVGETERVTGVLALTDRATTPGSVLAGATARASGARVLDVPGGDPRATSATVQGVHDARAEGATSGTVGLGPSFGTGDDLAWRVETAATGAELPGGGQVALPGRTYVALYGAPGAPVLGVLGEQDVPATIARAQEHAAAYEALTDQPVVPTLEIITTVASGSAGDDGNYSNERSADLVRPYVDAARDAGVYVVLDLQPGRTDFLTQAREYEDLLREPHVGLALDPEWRLAPDEVHLEQIGSVDVDEVNAVGDWLADMVREHDLPQKIFLLHQFRTSMITDRDRLDTAHPELAVVIHADGQGGQAAKAATWRRLHEDAPPGVWWGWKNFYDEDAPMLTPEQTWQVEPTPDFVSYQ
ncbi:hypothetical protein [Cellulosimicrobium marinum]|uniref:hypothetical protein n=1 Tax=Cellulosimicrobium marinum TaxID=1638992 RepID=UPI001E40C2A9|nr:hypothetical protein [Cellulosimicrobium marinum]MCB7136990.1 hypothetical protein [Cellulosimicrobium marinum]